MDENQVDWKIFLRPLEDNLSPEIIQSFINIIDNEICPETAVGGDCLSRDIADKYQNMSKDVLNEKHGDSSDSFDKKTRNKEYPLLNFSSASSLSSLSNTTEFTQGPIQESKAPQGDLKFSAIPENSTLSLLTGFNSDDCTDVVEKEKCQSPMLVKSDSNCGDDLCSLKKVKADIKKSASSSNWTQNDNSGTARSVSQFTFKELSMFNFKECVKRLTFAPSAVNDKHTRISENIFEYYNEVREMFIHRQTELKKETNIRILLDGWLMRMCKLHDLHIKTEETSGLKYLPGCRFDYLLYRSGGIPVGCVETKRPNSFGMKAFVQGVFQLCHVQQLACYKDAANGEVPIFGILTDGFRFILMAMKGKDLLLQHREPETLTETDVLRIRSLEKKDDFDSLVQDISNLMELSLS